MLTAFIPQSCWDTCSTSEVINGHLSSFDLNKSIIDRLSVDELDELTSFKISSISELTLVSLRNNSKAKHKINF